MEKHIFDVNQTDFSDEQSKEIWFIGKSIVPLEISLADISDAEMREGCTQIHKFISEMLWDMYCKHANYSSQNLDLLLNRFIRFGRIDESGCNLILPADAFKKHTRNFENFKNVFDSRGFIVSEIDNEILLRNSRYPLLLKYLYAYSKPSQKYGVNVVSCDFRVFTKKYKLTLDDFLRTQSDKYKIVFTNLHDYAIAKGAKLDTHNQYRRYTYIYKSEYILVFGMKPSIVVPYNNQYSKKRDSWIAFDLFMSEVEKQEDKENLIQYIQDNILLCNACKGRKIGPKTQSECCGHLLDIYGVKRLAASCHPEIEKSFTVNESQESINYNLKMIKRMIDIRVSQICKYDD